MSVLKTLLSGCSLPSTLDSSGNAAVHHIVDGNDFELLKILLDKRAEDVNVNGLNGSGISPLYQAILASDNEPRMLDFLLKVPDLDLNLPNADGTTPLSGTFQVREQEEDGFRDLRFNTA